MITRRQMFVTLGAFALGSPAFTDAQSLKLPRLGLLAPGTIDGYTQSLDAFRMGLQERGYTPDKNIMLVTRFANFQFPLLASLAAELLAQKVDIIVTFGTPATDAARKMTATVPIVMVSVGDPLAMGFVKSLSRPGQNVTGTSNVNPELLTKQVELLLDISPRISRIGVMLNPGNPAHHASLSQVSLVVSGRRVELMPLPAVNLSEIASALSTMADREAHAVIVRFDSVFNRLVREIADLALKRGLISIGARANYAVAGCLVSYGPNDDEFYRRAAYFVDRILKGARPAELPVEQPTRFELCVNLKTAKALGVAVPTALLVRADKVIE